MVQANPLGNSTARRHECSQNNLSFRWQKKHKWNKIPRRDDKWQYLSNDEMCRLLKRTQAAQAANKLYGLGPGEIGTPLLKMVHLYWGDKSGCFDMPVQLPNIFQAGLQSWLKAGATVVLWTHHPTVCGLPASFIASKQLLVLDACQYVATEAITYLHIHTHTHLSQIHMKQINP